MRFFIPTVLALAATISQVSSRALNQLQSRVIVVDVCAEVDAALAVDVLGVVVVFGTLDICLCVSAIVDILAVNAVVIAAVKVAGEAAVVAEITALINTAAGHETCSYPDHFEPICSKANPCGFQCKDGFTPFPPSNPVDCVCAPPNIVCNGICGDFGACPSSIAKRSVEYEKRNAVCDKGYTPCGVYGWAGMRASQAWECVATQSDLESCGGCIIPLTLGSPHGIDCTAIPGVADVSCGGGSCIVNRCLPGYTPSIDRSFCIRRSNLIFTADEGAPVAVYGFEHGRSEEA